MAKRIAVNHSDYVKTGPKAGGKTAIAVANGVTVFPNARRAVPDQGNAEGLRVLRRSSNAKIAAKHETISKGWAKGMPIYTLTLEERKTCPTSCAVYDVCYGNNMMFAHRFEAGAALESAIRQDVAQLAARHPHGFMVRLHVLGDFYSPEYVQVWNEMLARHAALNVYGYTARDPESDDIGRAVATLRAAHGRRAMLRWSGRAGAMGAVNVERGQPAAAIPCPGPGQTERAASCAACGLCWNTERAVSFLTH